MNEESILKFRIELQNLGYCEAVVNSYPKQIRWFLDYCKKEKEDITSRDILDYHKSLETTKSRVTKSNLSQSSIAGKMRSIRLYFDYLQRIGEIKINPYQLKIKSPKYEERKIFSREEITKLYEKSSPLQLIILHLCYGCGLRRNEAAELKIKDIDLENCLLYIKKGKGKKRRVIPFTKQVQRDIKDFIFSTEIEERDSPTLGRQNRNVETENLLNITAERIYEEFKKLLKKAGLENQNFTLHCLRHTIATQLLEQGMELEKVRDFLGHECLGTTQIYTRIHGESQRIFRK
ncbi:tyrosine-type recombinase/integrase [Chryseobacterium sp. SNU WT5]|uniref:tyrosine-type recombinase/integrase n=1 Tax=Chryseobacterium sp. SNU WT5 TaxID=2594269 RepID=UPI00117D1202|nr:tyrosine-type recombinase/integrase [Chryseobacterium sp. SNU WT5]QDP85239.1 tyrosine-type recombinase/integrase [Chryseobacterium sp. SNU WT5]